MRTMYKPSAWLMELNEASGKEVGAVATADFTLP